MPHTQDQQSTTRRPTSSTRDPRRRAMLWRVGVSAVAAAIVFGAGFGSGTWMTKQRIQSAFDEVHVSSSAPESGERTDVPEKPRTPEEYEAWAQAQGLPAGIPADVLPQLYQRYPDGIPKEIVDQIEAAIG